MTNYLVQFQWGEHLKKKLKVSIAHDGVSVPQTRVQIDGDAANCTREDVYSEPPALCDQKVMLKLKDKFYL